MSKAKKENLVEKFFGDYSGNDKFCMFIVLSRDGASELHTNFTDTAVATQMILGALAQINEQVISEAGMEILEAEVDGARH